MPFKHDATGNIVLADHNGKKLPVFVNSKGEESPFDADGTVEAIARLNGEAKAHRERAEAAEKNLKGFSGIDDPEAARKALSIVSNLDAKKLVDAGEIDRVRSEISGAFTEKLTAAEEKARALEAELYDLHIGGAFSRSKFIAEKAAIPADFMQARFGSNFGIKDGQIYAVDAAGREIYSKVNPGQLAEFDEALGILVDSNPQRAVILKGNGASGGGAQNGGGQGGGGKQTITRTEFDRMPPTEKAAAAKTMAIVDG